MNSKDGHGKWFDELLLNTQGLGGDPYESVTFRADKNRLYQYDLLWRSNDYFNPGLTSGGANGAHLLDTTYGSQDHNLTILPQSNIQFFLGYSRDTQNGAGLPTVPAFDPSDVFPVFANIRTVRNEYRVGNETRFHGIRINWMHGWEDFKDDTGYQFNSPGSALNSFLKTEPYHGTSPYWRLGLFYDRQAVNVNGRFTYTAGQEAYLLNESAFGLNLAGAAANRQVLSSGDGQRPVVTGNLNISVAPSSALTIVNQTSVYNVRTEGNSAFAEFDDATRAADFLFFEYLGIFTFSSQTDLTYRVTHWLGLHGGYHFSERRIRSVQQLLSGGGPAAPYDQTDRLNTGLFGVRLNATKSLTIAADGEIGRASLPFAPKSEGSYQAFAARARYKWKTLQLSAWSHTDYNLNSVTLSSYSSHARTYAASASWSPLSWFAFDTSYAKLHLNTIGGIAYFAGPQFIQGDQSYYVSNIHSGNVGVRAALRRYGTLYLGYSIVQDVGDGRGNPLAGPIVSSLPALQAAQTFPLRFQSPIARVSVRLAEKLRLNFGYQRYGYREDVYSQQDYHANTGYTSLLWAF